MVVTDGMAVLSCCSGLTWAVWRLIVLGSVLQHELSHFLAFKKPLYNKVLSMLSNTVLVVPTATTFRKYHQEHHSHLVRVATLSSVVLPVLSSGPVRLRSAATLACHHVCSVNAAHDASSVCASGCSPASNLHRVQCLSCILILNCRQGLHMHFASNLLRHVVHGIKLRTRVSCTFQMTGSSHCVYGLHWTAAC